MGKYIFLCDQDDEWESNKIELMTQVMSDNPQIQTLNCGVQLIDGNSEEIEYKPLKNRYNCGFLYSEQPIGKISYYSYPYLAFYNKPLVNYRRHSNNVIGANTGFIKGITLRTKQHRIQSCEEKEKASNAILTYYSRKNGGYKAT